MSEQKTPNPKWNYESALPPELTPEWKNSYFVNIKGTQTVKVDGLVTLAHLKGFTRFETEMVESPTQANQMNAIFKATIHGFGWDPVKKEVIPVVVTRYGDANPNNCNKMVASHFIRMAETRAVGRLLRAYLNVTFVTLEELDLIVQVPMMTKDQYARMSGLCSQYKIDSTTSFDIMQKSCGKNDINSLTFDEAEAYIKALSIHGANSSGAMSQSNPTSAPPRQTPPPQQNGAFMPSATSPQGQVPPAQTNTPQQAGKPPVTNYNLE